MTMENEAFNCYSMILLIDMQAEIKEDIELMEDIYKTHGDVMKDID